MALHYIYFLDISIQPAKSMHYLINSARRKLNPVLNHTNSRQNILFQPLEFTALISGKKIQAAPNKNFILPANPLYENSLSISSKS